MKLVLFSYKSRQSFLKKLVKYSKKSQSVFVRKNYLEIMASFCEFQSLRKTDIKVDNDDDDMGEDFMPD